MSDKTIEMLDTLQKSLDGKGAETQESINKQNIIIKALGDKHQESQNKFTKLEEQKQEQEKLNIELKERVDNLSKSSNRLGFSGQEEKDLNSVKVAFNEYLRKGTAIDPELAQRITACELKSLAQVSNDRDFKEFVAKSSHEQLGQGYILPNMSLKTMRVGVNEDGGYFVTPENNNNVIITREFETSPMRALANVQNTNAGSINIVINDNEAEAGWVGEEDPRPDTATPKTGELNIQLHELYSSPKYTRTLLQDSTFDFVTDLSNKIDDVFTRMENTSFVSGNGARKPRGFLDYPAATDSDTYQRGALPQIETANSGVITADDLLNLVMNTKQAYTANGSVLIKRSSWVDLVKLKDGNGSYLFNTNSMMSNGTAMSLLGFPVYFADDMQAIASNSLSVAFGDFRQGYTILDRMGSRYVIRDDVTDKPYTKFYTTKRVGGDVTNYEAIRILKTKA